MINPEAIKKRINEIKDKLRHGQSDDPYYLNGKREGFESCLANIDDLTIEKLQTGIDYYNAGNGGSLPFRQGIVDAYIEVGHMIQRDEASDRRNAEVNAATRYARIQQGGK